MGFDLYGISPVIRKGKMPEAPEKLWDKSTTEKEREKYFDKKWDFEEYNPGSYFRNNCWWWRSLWDYTYNECQDILTEKDWENGHSNSGHKISEEKAVLIGKREESSGTNKGGFMIFAAASNWISTILFKTFTSGKELCAGERP